MRALHAISLAVMLGATSLIAINASAQQGDPSTGAASPNASADTRSRPDAAPANSEAARMASRDARQAAAMNAHMGAIKAGLRLTPDQEKLWPPLEQALRDGMTSRMAMRQKMRDARSGASNPIDTLRTMADSAALRADNMRKLADAGKPLYDSLDDSQKQRVSRFLRGGPRMAMNEDQDFRRGPGMDRQNEPRGNPRRDEDRSRYGRGAESDGPRYNGRGDDRFDRRDRYGRNQNSGDRRSAPPRDDERRYGDRDGRSDRGRGDSGRENYGNDERGGSNRDDDNRDRGFRGRSQGGERYRRDERDGRNRSGGEDRDNTRL